MKHLVVALYFILLDCLHLAVYCVNCMSCLCLFVCLFVCALFWSCLDVFDFGLIGFEVLHSVSNLTCCFYVLVVTIFR